MPRICAISAPFPGVLQVLKHGQRLGLWDLVVLTGDIRTRVPEADVFLLGAWHPQYEFLVSFVMNMVKAKVAVLWTSSAGEVGFEPLEESYLASIMADPRISAVWFGHEGLASCFPEKGFYAPYPIDVPERILVGPVLEKGKTMTFFAPATLKKNRMNTFAAAVLIQRETDLVLETNQPVPACFPTLRVRHYDWLPEEKYRPLLAASALNLCPSWAETCNYQSIEAAFLGVPSVGSKAIPWLPEWAQADATNPIDIARVGLDVIGRGLELRLDALAWADLANALLRRRLEQRLFPLS